ncbi:hypothetical protein NV379_23045 [Paenibacillus sp. N1-5-1-14]|uniref:hypothetical protein n=1 Tax=Paenibacillus radicibacter TaxID=2972488 RepID=UPI0021592878|nr:hypothetical protein [Paenibacillus radicibacter]MCR8645518.1 hypothetical protein [Paenibacillus radicibacter]
MKKLKVLVLCVFFILTGCSGNQENKDTKSRSVIIDFSEQNNLNDWKVSMLTKLDLVGQQVYDLEFQYTGESPIKDITVYYRIDTKDKLSRSIVKADSKTIVSNLDKNEKIILSELILPLNTPISVEVDWLKGNFIDKGIGKFKIKEIK